MSAEAMGWVFRHSPFRGACFAVHLAIADSVSDVHGNEFWMARANLAMKARLSGETVSAAVETLRGGGWIEPVEDGMNDPAERQRAGRPTRWVFIFPEAKVIYENRRRGSGLPSTSKARGSRPTREGGSGSPARGSRLSRDVSQEEPNLDPKEDLPLTPFAAEDQPREESESPRGDQDQGARRERPRNEVWDALAEVFGQPATQGERAHFGKVCRELRNAGASGPEVLRRARRARAEWPKATVAAVSKHWTQLGRQGGPGRVDPAGDENWDRSAPTEVI
jgi:hypothetical protein